MKLSKSIFEKYASLKLTIKDAEAEIKKIQPILLKEMEETETEEVSSSYGKFFFVEKPKWTYPDEIVKMEETLDKAKEIARQKGTAQHTTTKYLQFNPKSNE